MQMIHPENLSPFGRLAVALDQEFSALERINGQLGRLEIETEAGLERAIKLLGEFAEHGQTLSSGMQNFSQALQAARESAEFSARTVAERAQSVQRRKEAQDEIQSRFGALAARVKEVSEKIAQVRKPEGPEEGLRLSAQLLGIDASLEEFSVQAKALKDEAQTGKFKSVERNAESLWGTLQSARRKISAVMPASH